MMRSRFVHNGAGEICATGSRMSSEVAPHDAGVDRRHHVFGIRHRSDEKVREPPQPVAVLHEQLGEAERLVRRHHTHVH